jgi:hypothetical protein
MSRIIGVLGNSRSAVARSRESCALWCGPYFRGLVNVTQFYGMRVVHMTEEASRS